MIILRTCQYGGVFRSRVRGATTIWPNLILAQCRAVDNTPYSAAPLATLVFSSAENFSYVPRVVTVPLSIMVSTTGFTWSLIASIREAGMVCVKDPLELGKTASLLPRLLSSFTRFVNFEILEQHHFVNA